MFATILESFLPPNPNADHFPPLGIFHDKERRMQRPQSPTWFVSCFRLLKMEVIIKHSPEVFAFARLDEFSRLYPSYDGLAFWSGDFLFKRWPLPRTGSCLEYRVAWSCRFAFYGGHHTVVLAMTHSTLVLTVVLSSGFQSFIISHHPTRTRHHILVRAVLLY